MEIEVKLLIGMSNDDLSDAEFFLVPITEKLYSTIQKHREYIKDNGIVSINDKSRASLMDENGHESDFNHSGIIMEVTQNSIYFHAVNKYVNTIITTSESLGDVILGDAIKKLKFKKKLKNFIDEPKET